MPFFVNSQMLRGPESFLAIFPRTRKGSVRFWKVAAGVGLKMSFS